MKWLHELKMENPDDQYVLEEMITCVEKRMEDADRLTRKLESYSSRERYQEKAANLQAFKGVAKVTALTVLAETGDFSRFEKASQFAAYVGLIPSDYSSGGKTLHGGITKAGNKTVRTALIEAVQALVKGSGTSKKSKVLQQRQADLNPMVIAYADRGTERVRSKFYGYKRRGMKYNKAIAACAREFACFIWGMMTGHMETREMKMFSQTAGCDPVTGEVIKADFETVAA